MISEKYKCVYIHIPKVAGTSISALLNDEIEMPLSGWDNEKKIWLQHVTCYEMLALGLIDHDKFSRYYKFTFVRNPWERMVSEYSWRVKYDVSFSTCKLPLRPQKNSLLKKIRNYFSIPKLSFKQFLSLTNEQITHNRSEKYKKEWEQHSKPQYLYLTDNKGSFLVDYIGRFENISTDWKKIAHRLDISGKKLPYKNISKKGDYTRYYDDETMEIVRKRYIKDIEYFKYEFGL